ncbi:leucyl aminopeptidase [Mycoplasma hyorhinis]|uniref:leucyl aminopeptidase family protein n=1 Tax=Mesomycoplasma hyorhinis TaxID=2100 RepID=UPI00136B72AF|nr:M17 family metallopeptidase [Mesomycoplasma hyorhinis]MXR09142.1 leucyl aminopeptidase [Mesomycoplasma hyorhinis]
MIKYSQMFSENSLVLRPAFNTNEREFLQKEKFATTEFLTEREVLLYLDEAKELSLEEMKKIASLLAKYPRELEVDLDAFFEFLSAKAQREFVEKLVDRYIYLNADVYSQRSDKEKTRAKIKDLTLVSSRLEDFQDFINKAETIANAVNFARLFQNTPPNICNSEFLADKIVEKLSTNANLKIRVLGKTQIQNLGMNLLLAVNKGSVYQPRLVTVEYNGNPDSEEKIALVGKGITFDSGGYNIKTGMFMRGMKYDMSGAIIAASAIDTIAKFSPKVNVVAVLPLTDNRVNGDANLPDNVWKSMNGKSVEITNTDAEGRLILGDALTYAIRELKANKLFTIATLTGAMSIALGSTFTGTFATDDSFWKKFRKAAELADELVWRMPLHAEFAKGNNSSPVADIVNADYSGKAGSSSAAMFVAEFRENLPLIHLDIAGTANVDKNPTGVMVKTLVEFILHHK